MTALLPCTLPPALFMIPDAHKTLIDSNDGWEKMQNTMLIQVLSYALSLLCVGSDYTHEFLLAHSCWFEPFPAARAEQLNQGPNDETGSNYVSVAREIPRCGAV
jgi:hypothetical protein